VLTLGPTLPRKRGKLPEDTDQKAPRANTGEITALARKWKPVPFSAVM